MDESLPQNVTNTHAKPHGTSEFEMNSSSKIFSFEVPLELKQDWMMGVTSLEVYNTVCSIALTNTKLEILLTDKQLIKTWR